MFAIHTKSPARNNKPLPVYGKGLNLSPVVTLVAVLFWGAILGSIGAMVAVPLTAIIASVLLISYPETKWLAILMREGDGSEE